MYARACRPRSSCSVKSVFFRFFAIILLQSVQESLGRRTASGSVSPRSVRDADVPLRTGREAGDAAERGLDVGDRRSLHVQLRA
jgi:hypothetical protein